MYFSLFVFLMIIMVISIIKRKNDVKALEYQEWMTNKGFVKVKITFYNEDEFDYNTTGIVTKESMLCYIQLGVYSFVLNKNTYSDIAIYPVIPDKNDDIKKIAPIVINTGAIKSVEKLDD